MEKREIKFRAWDNLQGGKFEYWDFKTNVYDGIFWTMIKDKSFEHPQEFTGLKDKNGKGNEVFEGDLFEVIFSNVPNGYAPMGHKEVVEKHIGEIVLHFGSFMLKVFHPIHKEKVFTDLKSFLENEEKIVFGNKFQHPELLK